jgi:hypothetical protein
MAKILLLILSIVVVFLFGIVSMRWGDLDLLASLKVSDRGLQ